jgi:hypothetical protein
MADETNVKELLDAAVKAGGLYVAKQIIESRVKELESTLGGPVPGTPPGAMSAQILNMPAAPRPVTKKKARKLSPEARMKIQEAQKRRWAEVKRQQKARA